jgi:homoserine dehydrogenase
MFLDELRVGLAGLGTVGTGVAKILLDDASWLEQRTGMPLRLQGIADLDLDRDRGLCLDGVSLHCDARALIQDPGIHVLIELIGGIEPARTLVLEALASGKHVITANKALLATHGDEIFQAAVDAGVQIGFEASVAGGIPILRSIREGLASDQILSMAGIINGTANYILSTMSEKGLDFPECLREAQEKGYAEADPTLDIEGQDTMHKLAILVALAHGVQIQPEKIYTEGIQHITGRDIRYAHDLGYCIKLLAVCVAEGTELEVRVHPTMIPREHMLAKVDQAFNAIYVTGKNSGPVMFFGQGAGMFPTAGAVVSDLVDIARSLRAGCGTRFLPLGFHDKIRSLPILRSTNDLLTNYYIRFPVADRPGVLAQIAGILGSHEISIHSVIQQGRHESGAVHIIILTHEARERNVQDALQEINRLDIMKGQGLLIRIEHTLDRNA